MYLSIIIYLSIYLYIYLYICLFFLSFYLSIFQARKTCMQLYDIVCILVMDDLWNCLPQKKNVSSFREGSQTPAKTHENCDLQVFFYKISFKTYLPLKPPQHIPAYPNNIVQGPPLQSLQSQELQHQELQHQELQHEGPGLQCWRYCFSNSRNISQCASGFKLFGWLYDLLWTFFSQHAELLEGAISSCPNTAREHLQFQDISDNLG